MALTLHHLDSITRKYMLEEILYDRMHKLLYLDPWLSVQGRKEFPFLLQQAAEYHHEDWLAEQLRQKDRLVSRMWDRKGQKFPSPQISFHLAETAFHTYYIRGVCQRALFENRESIVTYQAKSTLDPKVEKLFQPNSYPPLRMLKEMRS